MICVPLHHHSALRQVNRLVIHTCNSFLCVRELGLNVILIETLLIEYGAGETESSSTAGRRIDRQKSIGEQAGSKGCRPGRCQQHF
jgi:hypothetical protein